MEEGQDKMTILKKERRGEKGRTGLRFDVKLADLHHLQACKEVARYYYSSRVIFTLSDPGKCIPSEDRSGSLPPFPLTYQRLRENRQGKQRCLTVPHSMERQIQIH